MCYIYKAISTPTPSYGTLITTNPMHAKLRLCTYFAMMTVIAFYLQVNNGVNFNLLLLESWLSNLICPFYNLKCDILQKCFLRCSGVGFRISSLGQSPKSLIRKTYMEENELVLYDDKWQFYPKFNNVQRHGNVFYFANYL